jgi:hypothetical protein
MWESQWGEKRVYLKELGMAWRLVVKAYLKEIELE